MKAVIFDMDGTILDTIEDIAGAVNYVLGKFNMPLRSVEEIKWFVGNGLYKTLQRSVIENTKDELLSQMYEEMVPYYKEHSRIHTKPYEGIVDAINELKQAGFKTAVVSNKQHEAVVKLCEEFYSGLFDEMLGESKNIAIKPAPDMVNLVLKKLGVSSENAVYIGDSDVDIMTANNSNLDGVFVSWGFRGRNFLLEHGAEKIVDTPKEMVELIKSLGRGSL